MLVKWAKVSEEIFPMLFTKQHGTENTRDTVKDKYNSVQRVERMGQNSLWRVPYNFLLLLFVTCKLKNFKRTTNAINIQVKSVLITS